MGSLVYGLIRKMQVSPTPSCPDVIRASMWSPPGQSFPLSFLRADVDGRVEPGHDDPGAKANFLFASVH